MPTAAREIGVEKKRSGALSREASRRGYPTFRFTKRHIRTFFTHSLRLLPDMTAVVTSSSDVRHKLENDGRHLWDSLYGNVYFDGMELKGCIFTINNVSSDKMSSYVVIGMSG